jgi:hypothetical protein
VPTQTRRKLLSFKNWRNAKKQAKKYQKNGHRPNANTIRDVVDVAAIAHLAGFDASTCKIVTTGYTGKRDTVPMEELDEERLTPEILREMGLREIEWDGR